MGSHPGVGELPVVSQVVVVVGDHHQPLRGIVVFEDAMVLRPAASVGRRQRLGIGDLEERVEDGRQGVQIGEVVEHPFGKHPHHLGLEVGPVARAAEVVEDHEAALEEIVPESLLFGLVHLPEAGLGDVGQRIAVKLRVVEGEDVAAALVGVQEGRGGQDPGQVALGAGIVVRPGRLTPAPAAARQETARHPPPAGHVGADAHEGEAAVVGDVRFLDGGRRRTGRCRGRKGPAGFRRRLVGSDARTGYGGREHARGGGPCNPRHPDQRPGHHGCGCGLPRSVISRSWAASKLGARSSARSTVRRALATSPAWYCASASW